MSHFTVLCVVPKSVEIQKQDANIHEGDDDLAAYFIIKVKVNDEFRLAYIYPYAIVAMPKADGGYTVVRMD